MCILAAGSIIIDRKGIMFISAADGLGLDKHFATGPIAAMLVTKQLQAAHGRKTRAFLPSSSLTC